MNEVQIKKEKDRRKSKKLLLLFSLLALTVIAFVSSTYAWFLGMNEVKVNSLTMNIVTDETLEISLDGYTWSESVNITENTIKAHGDGDGAAYVGNNNSWIGEEGIIPVSSSGDNTKGMLEIFNKNSLSTTDGGYRLRSTKINNASSESDSYVAFDIFIKNNSGESYTEEYDLSADENIFLTNESSVIGTASGETAYGIQNSARVAFVQLGRISNEDLVYGTTPTIKCDTPAVGETYTTLCDKYSNVYKTVIWEPNDTDHDPAAVTHYNTVCRQRTAATPTYNTSNCTSITAGYVPTYTIKQNIEASYKVDIYDGLNTFTEDIQSDTDTYTKYLQNTKTFTDTMKETEGHYTVFKLAPYSVTKIRVYVYLEGQDVDNYDLVTKDSHITVTFGFTKKRENTDQLLDDENVVIPLTIAGESVNLDITYNEDLLVWENWIEETKTYESDGTTCNDYVCISESDDFVYARAEGDAIPRLRTTETIFYKDTSYYYSLKTDKINPKVGIYYMGVTPQY